jgi:uncharacterized protein YqjF (DUF2071 family)
LVHSLLQDVAHRPWEAPRGPWIWSQQWLDLLFAHWAVPLEKLRSCVPSSLDIETAAGSAWVSVVAFRMVNVRPRFLPPVGLVSNFLELNLRTYVRADGKPGVYFLSIHGSKSLAVGVARLLSPLPYVRARISFTCTPTDRRFESVCQSAETGPAAFSVMYQPQSRLCDSPVGSLDAWLTERYCMYASTRNGGLLRGEIHHQRWPLQKVHASVPVNSLGEPFGLDLSRTPDSVHYCAGIEAIAWPFEHVPIDAHSQLCK